MATKKEADMDLELPQSKPKYSAFWKFGPYNTATLSVEADSIEAFAEAIANVEGGLDAVVFISRKLADHTEEYFPPKEQTGLDLVKSELGGVEVSETQSGRKCDHGWMQYKTGKGAKGDWAAYFCPTPKGTPGQCKPVDAKTGRPWG